MQKNRLTAGLVLLLMIFTSVIVKAQDVSVSLEPSQIFIGEHATLIFNVNAGRDATIIFPVFQDEMHDKIEILHFGAHDTLKSGQEDIITITNRLRITSWEEGFHAIAPFAFTIISQSDTLLVESDPVLLEVAEFSIEEHTNLKDIKSILSAPVTLAELKWYIIGIILFALLVFLLIKYLRKRKPKPQPRTIWQKPEVPAHVAAIGSLENLKAKKLWQQGKVKEYHIELTDILRHYVEKRFNVGAMEMTTSEIMTALQSKKDLGENREDLQMMLQLADLVKFAKYSPSPIENENSMDKAFEFVRKTKTEVQEPQKPEPGKEVQEINPVKAQHSEDKKENEQPPKSKE